MKNMLRLTELNKREMNRILGGRPSHCGCGCGCPCQGSTPHADTLESQGDTTFSIAAGSLPATKTK